jgi:uncharacterized membrane protein YtjA (UPF0391 family)
LERFVNRIKMVAMRGAPFGALSLEEEKPMLRWAIAFFVIAIIAAIFGFGGIAVAAAGIAKILFFIFLVLFLVALLGGLARRA